MWRHGIGLGRATAALVQPGYRAMTALPRPINIRSLSRRSRQPGLPSRMTRRQRPTIRPGERASIPRSQESPGRHPAHRSAEESRFLPRTLASNGTFEALVDEPVVVEGNKLVPRGHYCSGRVESARSSSVRRDRGYVRLALDSIRIGDVDLPSSDLQPVRARQFFQKLALPRRCPSTLISYRDSPGKRPPFDLPPERTRLCGSQPTDSSRSLDSVLLRVFHRKNSRFSDICPSNPQAQFSIVGFETGFEMEVIALQIPISGKPRSRVRDKRFLSESLPRRVGHMSTAAGTRWTDQDSKTELQPFFENAPFAWAQCQRDGSMSHVESSLGKRARRHGRRCRNPFASGISFILKIDPKLNACFPNCLSVNDDSFQIESLTEARKCRPVRWTVWRVTDAQRRPRLCSRSGR